MLFPFLSLVNKCKSTKLSPCQHPPSHHLPTPVFFLSVSLKYTHILSHKGGKVSLWKQGGEISKSYLLRHE